MCVYKILSCELPLYTKELPSSYNYLIVLLHNEVYKNSISGSVLAYIATVKIIATLKVITSCYNTKGTS